MIQNIKLQAIKIKNSLNELYTLALITVGLPAIFYIYIDWKAALTVFVVTQIALGIVRERN